MTNNKVLVVKEEYIGNKPQNFCFKNERGRIKEETEGKRKSKWSIRAQAVRPDTVEVQLKMGRRRMRTAIKESLLSH